MTINESRPYILGYIFIGLAACCWGITGPLARFSFAAGITPLEVAFWRAAFGSLFFLTHAACTRSLKVRNIRDLLAFICFGAISLGGLFASNQWAIKTGGAALASVLLYTAPAWVALFSRIFFGERLTKIKIAAIAISLTGIIFISIPGAQDTANVTPLFSGAGVWFGLLAGLLYSTHYIFSKGYLKYYTPHVLYGYCMLFGAIALLPFIRCMPKSSEDWGILFILGLVCTYGAYLAYCAGLKRLAPTKAAVLATLEPVMATLAAWLLWKEDFSAFGWVGAALILGAVLCLVLERGKA